MPLLNYTTGIAAGRTISQIMDILARAGARQIVLDYNNDMPPLAEAITFIMQLEDQQIPFRLVCHWQRIHQILKTDKQVKTKRLKTPQHAQNVGWRIIKDWVEAQMAFIEAEQAELPQLFLPHAVGPGGRTVYEHIMEGNLLGSGEDVVEGEYG
jgi:hypothetical protein